jgi:hypothetical protein
MDSDVAVITILAVADVVTTNLAAFLLFYISSR